MNTEQHEILALQAVGFILQDDALRDRFIALSGIGVDDLRSNLAEPATLANVLEFLVSNEPDLIAAAEALSCKPEVLVQSWRALGGGAGQEW